QFRFRIYDDENILLYSSYDMNFPSSHPTGGPNRISMVSTQTQTQVYEYLDAFSITGLQDGYEMGDNLKEGLLLSYENIASFVWQGYSLDGQNIKTILGNTTIPMPDDGIHSIQVFGNDSLGTIYESDMRYFTMNSVGPDITITIPISSQLYGIIPPDFILSIPDSDLDSRWYSLDGGTTNITFSGFTGTIDQTEWNKIGNGTATITFYAMDTANNIGQAEISVRKDILAPLLTINAPITDDLFGLQPPQYDISVVEPNIDTMWYTLDSGATNVTFSSLTGTIDQTEWDKLGDGTVTLRFYVRDEGENEGFAEINVRKDISIPLITINTPIENQIFYDTAPSFDLTIIEGNLDAIWYTLDDGIINFSCEISGNIDNSYWNTIPTGVYTLKFYANDTVGNLGFSEVIILKELIEEPGIPGYNSFLLSLIIIIGIMGISLKIKKKSKKLII
ncbi:MAG: hypothetical protein KGD68_13745, partial [Candidatus Lokiarchaeota archaeon]|nr:hypothetical protein [Candidatus Lokiarchaeota archaeon]